MRWNYALVGIGIYALWFRPRLLRWGATSAELDQSYPGDDRIPRPNLQATRAITIDAPPAAIWPWLEQMGRAGTGFYGVDYLDHWNIPSLTHIRHDLLPLRQGLELDNGLEILESERDHYLLIGRFQMPHDCGDVSDFSHLYYLKLTPTDQTRLIVRTRVYSGGLSGWIFNRIFELMDYLMTVAQLRGIKARVEATQQSTSYRSVQLAEIV